MRKHSPVVKLKVIFEHMLCKKSNQEVEGKFGILRKFKRNLFPSHEVLQTYFVPNFQSEDSKGNFIEFSTDIIHFNIFWSSQNTF